MRHAVALVLGAAAVHCCSYVEVPFGDSFVIARSMELGGTFLESTWMTVAVPRGWKYPFLPLPVPDMEVGNDLQVEELQFKRRLGENATVERPMFFHAKHGFVANTGDLDLAGITLEELVIEGMNEHGLAISGHTHQGARYAEFDEEKFKQGITEVQYVALIPWVLGQYATVEEVLKGLDTIQVTSRESIPTALGIHWSVADATGASIVIESIDGLIKVHHNKVGVMTNDPSFDFHLHNLNQYSTITPLNPTHTNDFGEIETEIGSVPRPVGHGFNLVGMPGDYTPVSRFVKLFYTKQLAVYSKKPKTEADAINLATHIMNCVDIPQGVIAKLGRIDPGDYTQWVVIKSPSTGRYLYRPYDNMQWHSLDLKLLSKFFASSNEKARKIHMFNEDTGIKDVTNEFV